MNKTRHDSNLQCSSYRVTIEAFSTKLSKHLLLYVHRKKKAKKREEEINKQIKLGFLELKKGHGIQADYSFFSHLVNYADTTGFLR